MYFALRVSALLVLALGVLAAGFLLRSYIVFHDCAHGSFLPSKRANIWLGSVLGVILYTPFQCWRHGHAIHHATAADLDRRGVGDVPTLTVDEYHARDFIGRLRYRLFRNPLVMFGLGPLFAMMLLPRLAPRRRPAAHPTQRARHQRRAGGRDRLRLRLDRLAGLLADPGTGRDARRVRRYLVVLRPAPVRGHLLGAQSRLDVRRRRAPGQLVPEASAAPAVLHRQHRAAPRPSPQCADPQLQPSSRARRNPMLHSVPTLSLWDGLCAIRLKLWDEDSRKLVTFAQARAAGAARRSSLPG